MRRTQAILESVKKLDINYMTKMEYDEIIQTISKLKELKHSWEIYMGFE